MTEKFTLADLQAFANAYKVSPEEVTVTVVQNKSLVIIPVGLDPYRIPYGFSAEAVRITGERSRAARKPEIGFVGFREFDDQTEARSFAEMLELAAFTIRRRPLPNNRASIDVLEGDVGTVNEFLELCKAGVVVLLEMKLPDGFLDDMKKSLNVEKEED